MSDTKHEPTYEDHLAELVRFISTANEQVALRHIDEWSMSSRKHSDHPDYLCIEVSGRRGAHCFAFEVECSCNLAERFLDAMALLLGAIAAAKPLAKGDQVIGIRPKNTGN